MSVTRQLVRDRDRDRDRYRGIANIVSCVTPEQHHHPVYDHPQAQLQVPQQQQL